ncbi:hypothetical protein ACC692_36970, partial [Rhizobium ruizarguesonis]
VRRYLFAVRECDRKVGGTDENAIDADSAMQHAVSRCRAHGKFACAFAGDGERAGELLKFGFDLVIDGAETAQLRSGARRAINADRRIASAR